MMMMMTIVIDDDNDDDDDDELMMMTKGKLSLSLSCLAGQDRKRVEEVPLRFL